MMIKGADAKREVVVVGPEVDSEPDTEPPSEEEASSGMAVKVPTTEVRVVVPTAEVRVVLPELSVL